MKLKQEVYSIEEAAKLLGVHPNTIRRRIKDGSLPASQPHGFAGKKWFIAADSIRDFMRPTNVQRTK